MANSYFRFRQFVVQQQHSSMKVSTDSCLFGAWIADELQNRKINTCLDIGAGTGLLSLMVAQKTMAAIDAVEIEQDAANEAKDNVASSSWAERIQVVSADIRQWRPDNKYDVIISNPPFYEDDLTSPENKKNIAHHSTALKLTELVSLANTLLADDGSFFLLLPFKRAGEIDMILSQNGFFVLKYLLVRHSAAHPVSRILLLSGREKGREVQSSTLIITEGEEYTPAFKDLLGDYYLKI